MQKQQSELQKLLSFIEFERKYIWSKAHPIPGQDPSVRRWDDFMNEIRYSDHGNRASQWGWEFDHIIPKSLGGTDAWDNLRPLQWKFNAMRGARLFWGLIRKLASDPSIRKCNNQLLKCQVPRQ